MLNQNVFFLEDANQGVKPVKPVKPKISVLLPPTNVTAQQNVFAEAILEENSTRQ